MIKIKRALISVSDKQGLADFAGGLHRLGVEILSTGGTAKLLSSAGIPVKEVGSYTGFPEILDGRVKTLHPAIHGGLLALRDNPEHQKQLADHRIGLIDMVVVNLYPFGKVSQKKNVSLEEAIENIDIGGPSMLRSAAKNFKSVAVVSNPQRYAEVLNELNRNSGILSDKVLVNLAIDAFHHTAEYDRTIYEFLDGRLHKSTLSSSDSSVMPSSVNLAYAKMQDLRYGENPHQAAAFYRDAADLSGLAKARQIHGKELSFNNFLDLNAALRMVRDFDQPAAVIIKHNNPTGVAQDKMLSAAFANALACDPVSAFGGIIGFNRKLDRQTAQSIQKSGFMECIIAPGYDKGALAVLTKKKNLRLLELDLNDLKNPAFDFKPVAGGLLVQQPDVKPVDVSQWQIVTKRKPAATQMPSLEFGWKVVRHVRSNAIVLVKGTQTVGIGCGQTSRVQSVQLAIAKAGRKSRNSFLISDAFIPKTDNVVLAAKAGIKMIVQTGGSVADPEVIAAADKAKIVMVMTQSRHFMH
jgi:phosphoribosylaminoimidazolecarboxamide formyltransferase/IMP cyclohydrolase